jgi:hypothetical protein
MTTNGDAWKSDLVDPLDDRTGPALPRSESELLAMAQAVAQRAANPRSRGASSLGRGWQLAAAAVLALALAGSAWAAVIAYRHAEQRAERETAARMKASPPRPRPAQSPAMQSPAPSPQPAVAPAVPPRSEPTPASVADASRDLLEQANRMRAARRWRDAERLYARVAREYAGSDEAYVALIASATLRLEHTGRAQDALAMYRRALALRPRGDLVEQVRYGIAEAHRALAEPEQEARALRSFLDAHAASLRAPDARARLRELEAGRGF